MLLISMPSLQTPPGCLTSLRVITFLFEMNSLPLSPPSLSLPSSLFLSLSLPSSLPPSFLLPLFLLPSPSPSLCFPPSLSPSHAYLKLLSSGQLPASASEVTGDTPTLHCSQPFLGSWFVVHRRSRKRNVACFSLGLFLFMS